MFRDAAARPPDADPPAVGHPASARGWQAHLSLGFAARGGQSYLARRAHRGPLVVQRAFYPEGPSPCHAYVLHPPGGLVAGDELSIDLAVDPGAAAVVTTPAATKIYRSPRPTLVARQEQRLRVASGGALEWLPQEAIVFGGARAALTTTVDLAPDATFIGWEILCLGRPASGDAFSSGRCRQRFELARDGRPLCLERATLEAGAAALTGPWGWGGDTVSGTLLCSPPPAAALDDARALCAAAAARASVSVLDGVLVARALSPSAAAVRACFAALWHLLRPLVLGRPAVAPRIWAT